MQHYDAASRRWLTDVPRTGSQEEEGYASIATIIGYSKTLLLVRGKPPIRLSFHIPTGVAEIHPAAACLSSRALRRTNLLGASFFYGESWAGRFCVSLFLVDSLPLQEPSRNWIIVSGLSVGFCNPRRSIQRSVLLVRLCIMHTK